MVGRGLRGSIGGLVLLALGLWVPGCSGGAELVERRVLAMASAVERAESYGAYLRAEERSEDLGRGMSEAEVEEAMGVFVAVEERTGSDGKPLYRRVKLIEGRLCVRELSEQRQRWVFGYDERRVVYIGFALELKRGDAGDEWELKRVDRHPDDVCQSKG